MLDKYTIFLIGGITGILITLYLIKYMKLTKGETTTAGSLPHEEVITMTNTDKITDADKGIVHFGGESKEEIEAEDRWHEEQMTYTNPK